MKENKIFEALLDVIPFASYAVDVDTYELVYANKLMDENMYAPRATNCWEKLYGQEAKCSWCQIQQLKEREAIYRSKKLESDFFDESTDKWLQSYDEIVKWPDGRTVKYTILVDITEQKEIQADMINTNMKLALQSKKLREANQKLKYMAQKDFLTGINNRGYFFELAKRHFNKELEENQQIFVSMLDLDKFKNINDTYGHNMGDEVLKVFTKIVESNLDKDDIFGRVGGEEFALIISADTEEKVLLKLEQIRMESYNSIISNEKENIKFSVSIGVSMREENENLDVVLDKADKNLYKAKDDGRNKIKFRV